MSASGGMLASCSAWKALGLLEAGKAVVCWGEGETFYLKLRFDPKSLIVLPNGGHLTASVVEDMDVWRFFPPERKYLERLMAVARKSERCVENVGQEDWKYFEALLKASWDRIRSTAVLLRVASIVKGILKGLAETVDAHVEAHLPVLNASPSVGCPKTDERLGSMLDRSSLARLWEEAKRKGVWRRLSMVERGVLNLTIKCVDQLKSARLIGAVAKIVVKIKEALMSPLRRLMGQVGRPLARRLSMLACSWGNRAAAAWAEDEGFIKYLTVMDRAFQTHVSLY